MTQIESTLGQLHDATVLSMELAWRSGDFVMRVRTGAHHHQHLEFRASQVQFVEIPRRSPWGPSVSINEVRGPMRASGGVGGHRVEIEMQSGDTILVEAGAFEVAFVETGG